MTVIDDDVVSARKRQDIALARVVSSNLGELNGRPFTVCLKLRDHTFYMKKRGRKTPARLPSFKLEGQMIANSRMVSFSVLPKSSSRAASKHSLLDLDVDSLILRMTGLPALNRPVELIKIQGEDAYGALVETPAMRMSVYLAPARLFCKDKAFWNIEVHCCSS